MLNQSLQLLLSGMLTVFTVLGLVVLMGRLLIYLVNRFFSNSQASPLIHQQTATTPATTTTETLAAITAAVDITTAGTGRITAIELLPQDQETNP